MRETEPRLIRRVCQVMEIAIDSCLLDRSFVLPSQAHAHRVEDVQCVGEHDQRAPRVLLPQRGAEVADQV